MKRTFLVGGLALVWALSGSMGTANAQVDFATCAPDLPPCTSALTDCCSRTFDTVGTDRPIVIPMDRCHQRISAAGIEGPPATTSPAWCIDPSNVDDQGMLQAYGLVYRLMQNGIPVYWIINPSKDPPALTKAEPAGTQTYTERDIDAWILADGTTTGPLQVAAALTSCTAGCTDPVRAIDPATFNPIDDSYNYREFPLRGGAFVIAGEDRARFSDFYMRQGEFAALAGDANFDFTAVDLYEMDVGASFVYQDYRTPKPAYGLGSGGKAAPVALRIDYAPPRLARLGPGGQSQGWLTAAKLDSAAAYPGCKSGPFSPVDAVYCDISLGDIETGALVTGEFQWALLDSWVDASPCGSTAENTQVDQVRDFMTAVPSTRAGGGVLFMDGAIDVFENCPAKEPAGRSGVGVKTSAAGPADPIILRHAQNLLMQWADLPTDLAGGVVGQWRYVGGGANGYDPPHVAPSGSMVRLVTEDRAGAGNGLCANHVSAGGCDVYALSADADYVDVAVYLRFLDNAENGVAAYQGGTDLTGKSSHMRLALNSLLAMPAGVVPQVGDPRELSRSSPILAVVGGVESQYQGTYEVVDPTPPVSTYSGSVDDTSFEFPYFKGHLRGIDVADVPTTETPFDSLPFRFDAAATGQIPAVNPSGCTINFTSNCRTVFTTVETPDVVADDGLVLGPDRVFLDTDDVATLKPLMGPSLSDTDAATLISRVLAGVPDGAGGWEPRLGGIDRSTMAIIEPSPLIPAPAPGQERPTMIYVGATDGMLHAICAEAKGTACQAEGQELWAFIPRTQLPALRSNSSRIDGSPRVADVFDDFDPLDALVQREWRTILTIQTGSGIPGAAGLEPAVVAIDVTDPTNPVVLWERTTRATRTAIEQGVGLGLSMGPARLSGGVKNLTFVHGNNGGTGSSGFYFAAIDTATGAILWEKRHQYPPPRVSTNPPVPASGIPGGPVAFDRENSSFITHVVAPSLYGDLWLWQSDGVNPFGTQPLVRMATDFHPIGASPTLYADQGLGRLHAIVVTGGYADPIAATWSPDSAEQFLIGVALDPSPANVPFNELLVPDPGGERPIRESLGTGNRAFAQAVVAGNELFVTTDTTDVNALAYGSSTPTGLISRFGLDGTPKGQTNIAGGGSSVDVTATGTVHAGSGGGAVKIDAATIGGAAFDAVGKSIERNADESTQRLLWISG